MPVGHLTWLFPWFIHSSWLPPLSWLLNKTFSQGSKWRLLNLVPLAAMLLDFLENTMTSLVMARYPLHCPPGEILAPIFTPIKVVVRGR